MKKIFILSTIVILFIMPLIGAVDVINNNKDLDIGIENSSNADFTHTILVEYASKSTCPYCPAASTQLFSIYNSNDYDFYYVTMVTDKIVELPLLAYARIAGRLNGLGVLYIPDVYFDGGYKQITGRQQDEQPYRNAIVQSGEREVLDIDIDLNVKWIGLGSTIKIDATVTNNEPEEFNGNIKIYITEIESEWTDAQNNEYHYVVLDIPVDKSLSVKHQNYPKNQANPLDNSYKITKWWSGDISKNNCMVIASVFDKDSDYAVQTVSSIPTTVGLKELRSSSRFHNIFASIMEKFTNSFPLLKSLFSF